jgi:Restriction endonuclease EcoRV
VHMPNGQLDFPAEFTQETEKQHLAFEIRGILTANDKILTVGTDTKVLSTVFELLSQPLIQAIADRHKLQLETAPQTIYPDFTLMKDEDDCAKIAIDVKTTYRRTKGVAVFTLGSYTSFLRNDTKNILYPYSSYEKHWILGFVYSRAEAEESRVVEWKDRATIACPYLHVEWFVQEKYKIAGLVPGSGNTTNMASMATANIDDFRQGKGPFAKKGEKYFREYWANFSTTDGTKAYRTIEEFEKWKAEKKKLGAKT